MDTTNYGLSAYRSAPQKVASKCDLLEQAFLENYLKTTKAFQNSETEFSFVFYQEVSQKLSEKIDLNIGCIDENKTRKANPR